MNRRKTNTKVGLTPSGDRHMLRLCVGKMKMIAAEHPVVSIVDDDESVRESLLVLLGQFGFATRAFSSAQEFLSSGCIHETSCLILDVAMPGMSGPELHQELKCLGQEIPTIFITGQRDENVRDRLLKQGARGFLLKPLNDEALVATVKAAFVAENPVKSGNKICNEKGEPSG